MEAHQFAKRTADPDPDPDADPDSDPDPDPDAGAVADARADGWSHRTGRLSVGAVGP